MLEHATLRVRVLPEAAVAASLAVGGTVGIGLLFVLQAVGIPAWPVELVFLAGLLLFMRRQVLDAEYQVGPDGLTRRVMVRGLPSGSEQRWSWDAITAFDLDPEGTGHGRSVLAVRLRGGGRLRLREPSGPAGQDAHARFVDRFVGYATGDVGAPDEPGRERPRHEELRRRPLTSREAPQLRRTMTHAVAVPHPTSSVGFPDRRAGRVVMALAGLLVLALAAVSAWRGEDWGRWARGTLLLVPMGLWLMWRSMRGSGQI